MVSELPRDSLPNGSAMFMNYQIRHKTPDSLLLYREVSRLEVRLSMEIRLSLLT